MRFLEALNAPTITVQTFPDSEGSDHRPRIFHGPAEGLHRALEAQQRKGAGIYWMVNEGDGKGRRTENVTRVRAYFADLDGTPLYNSWPLPPTAIVNTSPGKYHVYWAVRDAPLDSATFSHVQSHIALLLGGDAVVKDLPRVMRLPGYMHLKAEPYPVTVECVNEAAVYSHADVWAYFGVPDMPPPPPPLPQKAQTYLERYAKGDGRASLKTAYNRVAEAGAGQRNHTLFRYAAAIGNDVKAGDVDAEEARGALIHAAEAAGLSQDEAERTVKSAWRYS